MKKFCYWIATCAFFVLAANSIADPTVKTTQIQTQSETETVTKPTAPLPQPARLWNLQDADIISIINEVSLETGKNFIVDPRVTGKISLVSSKPIKPDEVYEVFLSIISLLGYSAIPSGDVIKIVPNMESGEYATHVGSLNNPGRGDEVVVRVIPLENVSAAQLIPVLRPMLPQWSNVAAYTPGNVLILLGRASNIHRILQVINNLDHASDSHIEVVPLHQASASQMANVLNNLQNTGRSSGEAPQVTVAADERSNSILLGGNKAARFRMRTLIATLDSPTQGSHDNTQVIYLRYLQAKTLAPVLGKVAQNMLNKDGSVKGDTSPPPTGNNSNAGNNAGSRGPSKSSAPENFTNIQAEPNTNALIITAPPALMRALSAIVAKLDVRPAQVLVEAIFVEIDQNDLNNLGIQWGARIPDSNQPALTTAPGFPPFGEGIFGIIPKQQIQAVLSALQTKTGVNVLSTPSIVVLDNQKATLEIGQEVPQETGSYATSSNTSTVSPFNTFANKPVTLKLDVTPQINLGNSVRLKLVLKNDTLQNPENPGLNPIINISKIANTVIVNSDDILVLGGLISNSLTDSVDKIPILGDIPIIGLAFTHKTHQVVKKSLMVFLKPIIMHTPDQSSMLTQSKYDVIRNTQINWPEQDISSQGAQKIKNILPKWKNNLEIPSPFEDS